MRFSKEIKMDKKLLKILDNVLNNQKSTVDSDVKEISSSLEELKEFQSIYIKFENDNFKKLRDFLNSSTKFDSKFTKILENDLKKAIKNEKLIMLALTFENFSQKGSLSEVVMKKFRNLYDLMDQDLSVISLLGNDNYDDKQDLSDLLDTFKINEIPSIFKTSLIDVLFEPDGAMEWSIDGESRCQAIDTIMPLYTNKKVLDIYNEMLSTKLERKITANVENVINSITEMTVHPEKIFSLKEQNYMLSHLETIIKTFNIKVNNKNIFNVEDFNYERPALEMGIPVTSKSTREKIQINLDNFKNNIASNIIIQKPKPKI